MPYSDLREYLRALEGRGKLRHIPVEVDKDWEIAAVCRRVFQRVHPKERPALMFDKVKGFDIPVAAGTLGASPEVYALALECSPDEIHSRWERAQLSPIEPEAVATGPCKEVVLQGDEVDLYRFPIPMWTVPHDPAPFITAPCIVSRDAETGTYNVGTYRVQVKGKDKTGVLVGERQHLAIHVAKNDALGRPTPVAIVIGPDPTIEMTSVARVAYGVSELAVAGGLRGEPVAVVPCETVPLEVPATAEIVIEGEIPPNYRELEGPFGEYPGYMGASGDAPVIQVKCITHRRNVIYRAFFSQMPPSESSCIRGIGHEGAVFKHLRDDLRLPVVDFHLTESSGSAAIAIVAIRKQNPAQPRQVAQALWAFQPGLGKFLIVVEDDIDIRDPFAVEWAMSFRVQPERDIDIVRGVEAVGLDPSQAPPDVPHHDPIRMISSKVFIDATRKHRYPPLSLPPREHLERVDARWESYGLPA